MSETTYNECVQCDAWCCKYQLVVFNQKRNPEKHHYWILRSVMQVEEKETGDTIFGIYQPCPLLGQDNKCTIYNERSEVCKRFPNRYVPNWNSFCAAMRRLKDVKPKGFRILTNIKEKEYGTF